MKQRLTFAFMLLAVTLCAATTQDSILSMIPTGSSVYRHGYAELNASQRQSYDAILQSIARFDANFAGTIYHLP